MPPTHLTFQAPAGQAAVTAVYPRYSLTLAPFYSRPTAARSGKAPEDLQAGRQ